jgi:Holliday junction resolvase YEN1
VASVPEFLAKQLLKHFGFPWHVAPGEAEAECALLQREGIVDAVMSEDVDTLMFGSGMTLKSWTAEGSQKSPTHVNVYRSEETKEKSGLDTQGMILVALMSGGDYIVEGIPGCGPKVACDAARAGFGKDLCDLAARKDAVGLKVWRERLQHEIKTNESKLFSRRNTKLVIPDDFPNREVLGYYTHPCVSTTDKLDKLRDSLEWDQDIDFVALRAFTMDAFDWRCLGGAKKFIRNLAPAMLVRELRLRSDQLTAIDTVVQEAQEKSLISAIHGKRNHATTDGELELRISFIPQTLVPIDLSIEDPDDDFVPAGGAEEQSEAESDWGALPNSTQADEDEEAPTSPTKKRNFKPYYPDQPEKLWVLRNFVKVGCPLLVELFENPPRDAKAFFKARRQAKEAAKKDGAASKKKVTRKKKGDDMPANALLQFTAVVKSSQEPAAKSQSSQGREPLKPILSSNKAPSVIELDDDDAESCGFKLPLTSIPRKPSLDPATTTTKSDDEDDDPTPRPRQRGAVRKETRETGPAVRPFSQRASRDVQRTPQRRKRPAHDLTSSPAASQRTIDSFFSPSPLRSVSRLSTHAAQADVINLISSPASSMQPPPRARTPTPPTRRSMADDYDVVPLPDSVTRRRQRGPLKRARTTPSMLEDEADPGRAPPLFDRSVSSTSLGHVPTNQVIETLDLAIDSSPFGTRVAVLAPPEHIPETRRLSLSGNPASIVGTTSDRHRSQERNTTERHFSPLAQESIHELPAVRRSPRQAVQKEEKKRRIKLRESLQGAWTEVEAETMNLSGLVTPANTKRGRINARGWRKSGVEVLDLTAT